MLEITGNIVWINIKQFDKPNNNLYYIDKNYEIFNAFAS